MFFRNKASQATNLVEISNDGKGGGSRGEVFGSPPCHQEPDDNRHGHNDGQVGIEHRHWTKGYATGKG